MGHANLLPNYVVVSCLYPSVEHAIEEERKIRTDGIGHVCDLVKEVDIVGPLIHSLEVTFAHYLGVILLSASLFKFKHFLLTATATASPRAIAAVALPSSPWPPPVLGVEAQLWFADQDGIVPHVEIDSIVLHIN